MCASGTYKGVRSFTDLNDDGFLSGSDVRKLEQFYEHIDDIDLFVAGVLEARHEDALVGPAFKCIIGDQFIRWLILWRFSYLPRDIQPIINPSNLLYSFLFIGIVALD